MNTILELLFTLTVAGSVVVACILLLRFVFTDVFPTRWRYGIGKMAVGLYLLPIALGIKWISPFFTFNTLTSVPIVNELSPTLQHMLSGQSPVLIKEQYMLQHTISANVAFLLISIWSIGAIGFTTWQMYCYRRFLKNLKHTRTSVPGNSEAAKQLVLMKKALGQKSNVQLAYSSAILSPVLVGLWTPTIYLPSEKNENVDTVMVIHHELVHLKRKDLWIKAFTLVASALHWFNPLVHILRKDIHTWSELSCDEEVVKEMSYAERKRYGETILNVMEGSASLPVQFCASLSSEGKQLKRRLNMMLNVKKLKKHTIIMTAAVVIAVGAIGTSTAALAAKITPKVNTDTNQTIEGAGNSIRYKDVGDSVLINGVQYVKYRALPPDDQKFVIEEKLGAPVYALEGYEDPVFVDELTPDEQTQVTIEEGYFSPASIARLKGFREKFPRGKTVTITYEEDPSIPPGTSITIRDLTPEEKAALKQREEAAKSEGSRNLTPVKIIEKEPRFWK